MHLTTCTVEHTHKSPDCCEPECWCFRPALLILGLGSGEDGLGELSHEPHPNCQREGWHPRPECGACLNAAGELQEVRLAGAVSNGHGERRMERL